MAAGSLVHRTARAVAVAAIMLVATTVISGCAPAVGPTTKPSATSVAEPTTTTPKPTATPTKTPEPQLGEPVGITCEQLITPAEMLDFNPNVSLISDYTPAADTKASQIAGYKGLVCRWVNNSSNEKIDISVAKLDDETLTALKNTAVTESESVPTYGIPPEVEGYFTLYGDVGQAEVFSGKYWIVARSLAFFEPGDVQPLIEAALSHLP